MTWVLSQSSPSVIVRTVSAALPSSSSDRLPASRVTITMDGRSSEAAIPRDRTILDGAQQARPDLPFACKGGVCGTCRARIEAGAVDMVRNYALEAEEVASGFVLTCQSFPVTDEVTVDYDA